MAESKYKFPQFQFPGQKLIDSYGVVYEYNDKADCFVEMGEVEEIPVSSFDDTGLMTAVHKMNLDRIPDKAGGFAIIAPPKLRPISNDNPDGIIYGDIKLISDSLDIKCVDVDGNEIKGNCYNCIDGEDPPGFSFSLSEKFLDNFCARLPVIPGPRGDKGEKGDRGEPGTGDGPVGEQGDPGISYNEPGTFTGVKTLDVDGVYQQAVVDLDLDADNGQLTLVKADVATGDENTPADQVYCSQIFRDVVFDPEFGECGEGGDIWRYNITKGNDDLPEDIYLFRYPDEFIPPGETEVTVLLLSDFVNAVIEDLKGDYEAAVKKYDDEIKKYILEKDEATRQIICALAKELSECEWELPLEYCLGITPTDCNSAIGKLTQRMEEIANTIDSTLSSFTTVGPFVPCP